MENNLPKNPSQNPSLSKLEKPTFIDSIKNIFTAKPAQKKSKYRRTEPIWMYRNE